MEGRGWAADPVTWYAEGEFKAVSSGERERLAAFERKLVALGLKAGRW